MTGWIKLHRCITENKLYFSDRFTRMQAWTDLLLLASHVPATFFIRGHEINLLPGDIGYSQLSLAKRWKWNRKSVAKFLELLKKHEMADTIKDPFTTIIRIKNWDYYQGYGHQSGQQDGHLRDNKTDTYKNDKNVKNEEKGATPSFRNQHQENKRNSSDGSNKTSCTGGLKQRGYIPDAARINARYEELKQLFQNN